MMTFERSSLSKKLTAIAVLSTAAALLLVFVALAVTSVLQRRQDEGVQLASFAGVVGANSIHALLFKDRQLAGQTLAALEAKGGIAAAALFDCNGQLFARYQGAGQDDPAPVLRLPDVASAPLASVWSTRLRVLRPVMHDGQRIGSVMLEADLSAMWLGMLRFLGVIGAAMAGAMLVAVLMAWRLMRGMTDPIVRLIETAQQVSRSQNYSLRIAHQRRDELGTLIDAFNAMLAQVEGRGAALAHHRDELERQVGVRTEQLEKAKNSAEAASRAKSAFLATMSHEIRTPMNGVLGMTEMLLATHLSEAQRNYTNMVKRSGEHLLVIINDILDFSKIEAGKLTIEYIHFNLCDLLDDIDHAFRPQAQLKGIDFQFEMAPDIPLAVCGDPNRLRQVMANLLGNAIKFTERGRITARASVASEDVQRVSLRFEVRDTGIGIAREARERIFDAFSQADNSTTRKYGGTGLGLAISRQLVELMGGKIGVDQMVRQGSTFWFSVSFDKRRVAPEPASLMQHAMQGARVLIVDEHADSRDALAQQLAKWQMLTDCADCATSAFDRLQQAARGAAPYEVALIDMDLQRTSGLALAAAIKADALTRDTRIVLLSAERCAADAVQRRQAGVAYQLIKPVRGGDLYECMLLRPRSQLALPAVTPQPARKAQPVTWGGRRRSVLLAEDNPVNVDVALAMLDGLGLATTCVPNGASALQAMQTGDFDVVLMDCQMPVMDGFAATAAIRRQQQLQGQGRNLPIIAITANALQGDREACLAAGMDDYLSKPFTQHELAAVIARWIGMPLAATVHHAEAAAQQVTAHGVINCRALEHIRALSKERGDALLHQVILTYVDDTPQQLCSLRQAIDGADPNGLRRTAHSLKSSSANVGADALAQLCKQMEQLGRADCTTGACAILHDMELAFEAVRHSLNAILEKES